MNDIRGVGGRPSVPARSQLQTAQRPVAATRNPAVATDPTAQQQPQPTPRATKWLRLRGKKLHIVLAAAGIVVLVVGGLVGYVLYQNSQNTDNALSDRIINKVTKLYLVPEGEEPTVAEIKDKEKLKDQSFFDSAQNGDYLLVYQNAKIAMIYRESADKLVNVGPISPAASQNAEAAPAE